MDTSMTVREIQIRIFKERKETFITGLRFSGGGDDQAIGVIDLHINGECEKLEIPDGYHIVGIHGLYDSLIRGIGFILHNQHYVSNELVSAKYATI